jgi:putative transposase
MTIKHSVRSWHRPPHIYQDDTVYFITVRALNKLRYFDTDEKKDILSDVIQKGCEMFSIELSAWILLDNHYHILVEISTGRDVPQFVNNVNANSSRLLNKLDNSIGRKIWHQYFDRCIRNEKDYWTRFNYIHHNCIKHGYSNRMEDYQYSSYRSLVEEKGTEWMEDVFRSYPIVDFSVEGEI